MGLKTIKTHRIKLSKNYKMFIFSQVPAMWTPERQTSEVGVHGTQNSAWDTAGPNAGL